MAVTYLYQHPDPVIRRAVASVEHGIQISVTRDDWPKVRAAFLEQSDEWEWTQSPHVARCCRAEIARVDALFTHPQRDVACGGDVILTVGVA